MLMVMVWIKPYPKLEHTTSVTDDETAWQKLTLVRNCCLPALKTASVKGGHDVEETATLYHRFKSCGSPTFRVDAAAALMPRFLRMSEVRFEVESWA